MTLYRYNKTLRATQRQKHYIHLPNSHDIIVLFEGKTIFEMNQLASDIRALLPNKKLTLCGYISKIKKKEQGKIAHFDKLITKKQLTLFLNPTKADIAWIQTIPCDLLINLENTPNNALDILTAASSASMKCGRNNTRKPHLLDFIIDLPTSATSTDLLKQIINYTNTIQSK